MGKGIVIHRAHGNPPIRPAPWPPQKDPRVARTSPTMNKLLTGPIVLWALVFAFGHACAADLVIAHISPLTGPIAPNGQGLLVGARAYFEQVNAAGGVNGNKIVLTAADDAYKPDESV